MNLVRKYIRKILAEAYEDLVDVGFRVLIKNTDPSDPTLQDIMTDLRGVQNVVTVRQSAPMEPGPSAGTNYVNLMIGFEDDVEFDVPDLEKELENTRGVVSVILKNYDGVKWTEAQKTYTGGKRIKR